MAKHRAIRILPFTLLAVVLFGWLMIPPFAKQFSRNAIYELQAPAIAAASVTRDLQEYWSLRIGPGSSKAEMMETARDIAREANYYELQIQRNETLQNELRRLEELLGLPQPPEYRYEVARVARRDMNAWWQQLIVRKGSVHGIPEGAAVVFNGGVVGRVTEVHLYTSVVELVSSPRFRMAANIAGDERPVTYQGKVSTTMRPPLGRVKDVPPDIHVPPGETLQLVSSRLGGIFPHGLNIGQVRRLEPGSDGLFQRGEVTLHPGLRSLNEVAILVPVEPETP